MLVDGRGGVLRGLACGRHLRGARLAAACERDVLDLAHAAAREQCLLGVENGLLGHDVEAGGHAVCGRRLCRRGLGNRAEPLGHGLGLRLGRALRTLSGGASQPSAAGAANAKEQGLLLAKAVEGLRVDVLGEDGELAAPERGVCHEANDGPAHERVALALRLALDELRGLLVNLRVEGAHGEVVLAGDEDRVERGCGVDAVDDVGLGLHLAGGLLGELLEGERRSEALGRGAKQAADALLKDVKEVHATHPPYVSARGRWSR